MMEFGVGDGRLEIEIENEINVNDSPNTQDWKKFRVVAGEFTEEERAFCIRNGLVAVDEDGDYRELSTIIDSDGDTDEEEENVEPTTEPREEKAGGRKSKKSLSSFNKSVDDSLGSLNPRPSNSRKDNRKSNGRGSYTRILSPLVTNSSMGEGLDEGSISGISKPDLLSPLYTPESKGGSSIKQMEDLDSTPTNVKSPEAELVNYSEATPKTATQGEGDVSLYERNETVPMATPERGMETLPFAFATPTPGKEGINSISAPATDPSAPRATPDRGMALPFAFTSPSPGRASPGMNSISAPTPGSSDPMATPGREGIDSISAPTPDSSGVTPVTPFGSEDAHLTEPAPEVVGPIPTPKAFLNQEDESLASIECPATYSSPPDFNSPLPMHSNVSRLGSTLFQTPVSFLSPASRERLNQTVELMDISYGDVADEIDANSSDSCKDDFSLKMDHPVVISEKYIEVPTNVQIIDEILDMKGTEENFFAGRMQSSTESSTPSTVIELAPKNREDQDQNNRAVAAATEKSRHYDILILEPREPNGTFGAGVDDEFVEEYLTSCVDTKGIDAMSPASVAEEISFNNTCDSLADISLDDISNTSFNLSDVEDDNGPPGPNESFRTCPSIVSTTSFTSCHEEIDDSHVEEGRSSIEPINEEVKSFEDLDDTMTMVEKLLMKAEELEAAESNNRPAEEMESKSPLSYLLHPPMTPAKMDFHSNTSPDELSPSIFATPKTPIKNKSANGVIFATPAGPAPRAKTTNLESNYFSPSSKPALPPTPPRITTKPSSPSPKSTPGSSPSPKRTTPRKLNNILDSPIRKTPVPPKVTGMKTPSKIMPVSSPVAQYIYSVPPPVQVRKMMNPPKMPSVPSPKNKNVDTRIPRMNKPSMPGPSVSDGETEFPVQKKPGRDTISSLFPQAKAGKELAQTNYVGPESVKSVSGSITTPSKLPTPKLGNTPAFGSSKHLGVRDSSNASMVAQQPAVRKFCPERLGKP